MDCLKKVFSNSIFNKYESVYSILFYLLIFNCTFLTASSPSSYRLDGSSSYAKYLPWQPCLNDTFEFEFKTVEYNCLIFYSQFNAYTYIQIHLSNGYLKMKFRMHETDDPDGIYLEHTYDRLNDDRWHSLVVRRLSDITKLLVDYDKSYTYKHRNMRMNDNEHENTNNLFVFGGLPNYIQTYDLSSSTVLFEKRYVGSIRNPRLLNCSMNFMQKIILIESYGLIYSNKTDFCFHNPCLNNGLCIVTDSNYHCDCTYESFEGNHCERCKFKSKLLKKESVLELL